MLQKMSLQKRFAVMLIMIFFISLPLVGIVAYIVLQKNVNEAAFEQATFFLNTMEDIRLHVGKVMRPAAQDNMPGKFDVRLMSTSYAARNVAERLKDKFPEYTFQHISMNPRNPVNRANSFEEGVIRFFSDNRNVQESKGFINKGHIEYFYVARPVISDNSCMQCHSTAESAPHEVVETYGTTAAFGWQPNQVVASLIVYVPTKLAKAHALQALLTFMGLYAAVFVLILFMIDRTIVNGIITPIKNFAVAAEEVSKGNFDKDFTTTSNDEIKTLADAFKRMKVSIITSVKLIEKYKQKGPS
jgi:methyl-accepting chemotaxis protein